MADLPSTILPESSYRLSSEARERLLPSIEKQALCLPDPSTLQWKFSGQQAKQPSRCRQEVQHEMYGDSMDLDEHVRDVPHRRLEESSSHDWPYYNVDSTSTQHNTVTQSTGQYTKESIPWDAEDDVFNAPSSGGISNFPRRSSSEYLVPAGYVQASTCRRASPLPESSTSSIRISSSEDWTGSWEPGGQGGEKLCCSEPGCRATFQGSYAKGSLARHRRLKHGSHQNRDSRDYDCEEPGCSKSYRRQDARLKHYRKVHRHLAPGPALSRTKYRADSDSGSHVRSVDDPDVGGSRSQYPYLPQSPSLSQLTKFFSPKSPSSSAPSVEVRILRWEE